MPIDPNIPLQVRPPQVDPVRIAEQAMTLRQMAQGGLLQDQQLKAAQLENQQREQDMRDQQTIRQAYMDSGGDMDKFQQLVSQRGASPKAIGAIQQQILARKKDLAQLEETDLKNHQAHVARLGSESQALLGDPKRADNWAATRARLIKDGDIKPEEAPESYPGDDWLKLHANAAKTASDQIKEEMDRRRVAAAETAANARATASASTAAKNNAELPGIQAKADQDARANAATKLSAAATQDDYRAVWEQLPAGVARAFPVPEKFDPKTTPAQVRQLGMTPAQASTAANQNATRAETARHNRVTEAQGQERNDLARDKYDDQTGDTTTGNSRAIDRRQAQAQIQKLQFNENKLNRTRSQLGTAISSGKIYVDDHGKVIPMDKASEGDAETAKALLKEMQTRYGDTTEQLKKTIGDKNGLYGRLGVTPKVSTEDAIAALDAGDKKLFGDNAPAPKKEAPAAAPAAGQAEAAEAGKPNNDAVHGQLKKANVPVSGYTNDGYPIIFSGGKRYKATGFQNGRIQAVPLN